MVRLVERFLEPAARLTIDFPNRILERLECLGEIRELRVEDLRGSAGLYRLREELLARVNNAAQPAKVNDVLFKEMLVQ